MVKAWLTGTEGARKEDRVNHEHLRGAACESITYRFQMPWLESVPIAVSNNIDEKELTRLAQKVEWKRDRWRIV